MLRFIILLIIFFATGCQQKQVFLPHKKVNFPTGEEILPGDIVLGRSYGLIGAMLSKMGAISGKYSHGAMVYRDTDGNLMMLNYRPHGMETCTVEEYFSRYNRLALIRYKYSLDLATPKPSTGLSANLRGEDALSYEAMRWLNINKKTPIPPDYHMNPNDQSEMFCLELVSTVYRNNQLPDPFAESIPVTQDPLLAKAKKMFNVDIERITSPSVVLESSDFITLSEWLRPDYDLKDETINEAIIYSLADYLSLGYVPRNPNFWGKFKLNKVLFLYHIITKTMFWRPQQKFPDFVNKQSIYYGYMLYEHATKTKKLAKKIIAEKQQDGLLLDNNKNALHDVEKIVREVSDSLRDKYYILEQ